MKFKRGMICFLSFSILCVGIFAVSKPLSKIIGVSSSEYKNPSNISFSDAIFYACIVDSYNNENGTEYDYDVNLTDEQLATITSANCIDKDKYGAISSTAGIEKLVNLSDLQIFMENGSTFDLSNNQNLINLKYEGYFPTDGLDLSQNLQLEKLSMRCYDGTCSNMMATDLSHNTELEKIYFDSASSDITRYEIDFSDNPKLRDLKIFGLNIADIDLSSNTDLESLTINFSELGFIDLSHNINLKSLNLDSNELTAIDLSNNVDLEYLNLSYNHIKLINLNTNTELNELILMHTGLVQINLDNNTKLKKLDLSNISDSCYSCSSNKISTINLDNNTNLEELNLSGNKLDEINLQYNTELKKLDLSSNHFQSVDLSHNIKLEELILGNTIGNYLYEELSNRFKSLSSKENVNLKSLWIEFTDLESIDLSNNSSLELISLYGNKLSSLDLSNKPALISAWLDHNKLKSLDLTGDTALVSGELLLNNQNQSFSLLKNRYDNTEAELVELINDQGFKDEYIVDIEIIGFESNEDYKFSYNVDWYEATTDESSYDMSGYNIWVKDADVHSFINNFWSTDGNLVFVVYDENDNEYLYSDYSGSFQGSHTYKLRVKPSGSQSDADPIVEYNLYFSVLGIDLNSNDVNLNLSNNKTYQLSTTVTPEYATNKNVTWTSSNESVATVSESGLVTAVGQGETTITVQSVENPSVVATCTVAVTGSSTDNGDKYTIIEDSNPNNPDVVSINVFGTTVEELDFGADYEYVVYHGENIKSSQNKIATGDRIKIYSKNDNSNVVTEYVASVKGDLNGSGTVNSTDMISLRRYIKKVLNQEDVEACYLLAGDFTGNGNINATDIKGLRSYIKEILISGN